MNMPNLMSPKVLLYDSDSTSVLTGSLLRIAECARIELRKFLDITYDSETKYEFILQASFKK